MSRATCRVRNGPSSKPGSSPPPSLPPRSRWNAACVAASPARPDVAGSSRGSPEQHARRDRRWRVAIAASLLASLAIGWSLMMPRADQPRLAGTSAPAKRPAPFVASRTVRLGSIRGIEGVAGHQLSRADAPGELVIEPEVVVLTCEDGTMEFECPGGGSPDRPAVSRIRDGSRRPPAGHAGVAFAAPGSAVAHAAVVHAARARQTRGRGLRPDRARPRAGPRGSGRTLLPCASRSS